MTASRRHASRRHAPRRSHPAVRRTRQRRRRGRDRRDLRGRRGDGLPAGQPDGRPEAIRALWEKVLAARAALRAGGAAAHPDQR